MHPFNKRRGLIQQLTNIGMSLQKERRKGSLKSLKISLMRLEITKNQPQLKKKRVARGGPAVGSGKEHAPASTRKEVYISPERKQAMMDHGVWDDPVLRQKYVKRYMEWDRANKT